MSGDFETLEINQPKITYLKPEENTGWLDKLIKNIEDMKNKISRDCLLYTSPSPRDGLLSRMPSSA